jgi:hypothetical protein
LYNFIKSETTIKAPFKTKLEFHLQNRLLFGQPFCQANSISLAEINGQIVYREVVSLFMFKIMGKDSNF